LFISIEGIDNTGKSTICRELKKSLEKMGHKVTLVSDPTKEKPWGGLKRIIEGDRDITTPARATLFLAARLDAVSRVIKPALGRGEYVISDRFVDSWFAYQITKFEKLMPREEAFRLLLDVHESFQAAGLLLDPDRTYLITEDPKILFKRGRGKARSVYDEIRTQERVQENYLWLLNRFGTNRVKRITANDRESSQVAEELLADIERNSGTQIIRNAQI
jgi:dTMP kinase